MSTDRVQLRGFGAVAAFVLLVVATLGTQAPVVAHGNNCVVGNMNQVVIVLQHVNFGGINDDLCWSDGALSEDNLLDADHASTDDIGENGNFHDSVSSISMKNSGARGLCAEFYFDGFLGGGVAAKFYVPAGAGDWHFSPVPNNDSYDSVDLRRVDSQGACVN